MNSEPKTTLLETQLLDLDGTLSSIERLGGGHTEALLYTAEKDKHKVVIKIGDRDMNNDEIDANRIGYESISAMGASMLLPSNIEYGQVDGRHFIIMSHLGADIAQQDRRNSFSVGNYEDLIAHLETTIYATLRKNSLQKHKEGLDVYLDQLQYRGGMLVENEMMTQEELAEFTTDTSLICSPTTSLMLQDFTPDNTFFDGSKLSFIDPWQQTTYQGSFIPSLGQFVTLSTDIYKLQHALEARNQFEESMRRIGAALDLTPEKIQAQAQLGYALQYLLSAFVRISSNPNACREYIEAAKDCMHTLNEMVSLVRAKGRPLGRAAIEDISL
jgi:hypothetical protein